jgi:2-polyprenyl-6-methoxyphenol hydroxylase-like FAD-dependent oxidoreductase
MEELGLADRLHQLPHSKMRKITVHTNNQQSAAFGADFTRLKTRYPYIMMLPQVKFLEFIIEEAKRYPSFQLVLGANVQELIEEDGVIRGVRYRGHGGWHEIGQRLQSVRMSSFPPASIGGFEAIETSPPWMCFGSASRESQMKLKG